MPAFVLSQEPSRLTHYDVVGVYSEDHFVKHVALYNADGGTLCRGQVADVTHMKPPFEPEGKVKADCAGIVPLTNEELREIDLWLAEIADEYARHRATEPRQQYYIHPPFQNYPPSGVRRYRRYSCVGFVLDAYAEIGIHLLELETNRLPSVDKPTLFWAYPDAVRLQSVFPRLGLEGDGPWRIVLPGYVLHSLSRESQDIRRQPYCAQPGDERYHSSLPREE